jgi:predicted nucleotidyltransferase
MKAKLSTLILRIPSFLHQQLKQEARSADVSLNKYCRNLLDRKAGGSSAEDPPVSMMLEVGRSRPTELLRDLSAQVLEGLRDNIEGLVLFGSSARGRQTEKSDIDLLIVLSGSMALDRDVYSHWRPRRFNGREVAPLFVQIPEKGERVGGLWFEVALDGIVLYDKNLRLSRFFSRVRKLIADGQARRMFTHGHPYWVHSDGIRGDLSSSGGA